MKKEIFKKEYSDESLYDLPRDIEETLDPDFNEKYKNLPEINGFKEGVFIVTINWVKQ